MINVETSSDTGIAAAPYLMLWELELNVCFPSCVCFLEIMIGVVCFDEPK